VSSPEDNKIDFEKLSLSAELSDSLEPIPNGIGEPAPIDQDLQSEAKTEAEPALEEKIAEQEEVAAPELPPGQPPGKLQALINKLSVAEPFNVMLAIAVAALLIAILCCIVELGRYGFHVSAKQARTAASISAPAEIHRSLG
jgi:hypothetical protein